MFFKNIKTIVFILILLCALSVILFYETATYVPNKIVNDENKIIDMESELDINNEMGINQTDYEGKGEYPAKCFIPANAKIIHPENLDTNSNYVIIRSHWSYDPEKYIIAYEISGNPTKTVILIAFKDSGSWKEFDRIEVVNEKLTQMRILESTYLVLCLESNELPNAKHLKIFYSGVDGLESKCEKNYDKIEFLTMPNPYGGYAKEELISIWQRIEKEIYKVDLYQYDDWHFTLKEALNFYPPYFKKIVRNYKEIESNYSSSSTYWEWLADAQIKAGMPVEALESIAKYEQLINKDTLLSYHIQLIKSQALFMLRRFNESISITNRLISVLENKLSLESKNYKNVKEKIAKNTDLLMVLKESYRVLINATVESQKNIDVWDISAKQSSFLENYFQDIYYYEKYPEYNLRKSYYQRMYCKQILLEVKRAVLKWSQKEWTNALESLDSLSKEKDIYVKAKWVLCWKGNKLFKHKLFKLLWIDSDFHLLFWKENGNLYSQEFIGYDDDHPFMEPSALVEGRIVWKEQMPEMVLIYNNNTGGTGIGQINLIIMKLINHKWKIKWLPNDNWRNNVYEVTFLGSGVDKVLVKSDSYAENNSRELSGLAHGDRHIEYEDIWIKKGDKYILETSRTIPSEINTISEFVYNIGKNDDKEALKWVLNKELLDFAKLNKFEEACFCKYLDDEQDIKKMLISVNEKSFIVSFVKKEDQYYISEIKEK